MPFKIEQLPNNKFKVPFNKWAEVEIPETQIPEAKLKRWGDECFINIRYLDFTPVLPKQSEGKLKWVNSDKEVHLYPLEENKFEFEIIENKKTAPEIVLDLELHNVVGYRQPPLTEEFKNGWSDEFQREIVVTETTVKDSDGNILVYRPENIVDSIVFYHATKGNIHPVGEAEKYETSQIGFLYRSKSIDSNGWEVWNKQEIKDGKLIITRPQDFIDNAVYPVRHAGGETFGYETEGGTASGIGAYGPYFELFQSGVAGTGVSISACVDGDDANYFKWAIYDSSKGYIQTTDQSSTGVFSKEFLSLNFTSAPPILASTNYYLGAAGGGTGSTSLFWNSSSGQDYFYDTTVFGSLWPDPAEATGSGTTRLYSIYCTYTPAAAGTNMEINIGDAWKEVTKVEVNVGDAWKEATKVEINVGDTWKTVF